MGHDITLKILIGVLTAAVLFGSCAIVTSLDELRFSQEALTRALAQGGVPASASTPKEGTPVQVIGNARYFDPAAEPGGRMVQAIMADTRNLNYLLNNEATAAAFWGLCNDALAERDYANPDQFVPLLAESWSISKDHKSYRIKLRKNVKYHDFTDPVTGKAWHDVTVTAQDFQFFCKVVKNEKVNCAALRGYYQDMDSVEIVNDHEFIVHWKKPYYGSLSATLGMMPLPRHLYCAGPGPFDPAKFNDDHARNRIIVGCGPYRFVRWDKDRRVLFEAFDGYYGKALGIAPSLKTVCYELIKHPNTRFQALLSGDLDLLSLTPDQWMNRTGGVPFQDGTFRKLDWLSGSFSYIGYNLDNPLFADKRVRQSLAMLVDREAILQKVYRGLGRVAVGTFDPNSRFEDPDIKPWPFDPECAKKQLGEAGWHDSDGDGILDKDGRKFEFTMLAIASHPIQEKMLSMIQETFAAAGIRMMIRTVEWSVYVQKLDQRDFEVCSLGWTTSFDPDPYQLWHSSQCNASGGSNFIGFRNAEADKIIEELRGCFDTARRLELCHRFSRLLHEEQPYTFLFHPKSLTVISGRYRNVRVFPQGLAERLLWTPRSLQQALPGL